MKKSSVLLLLCYSLSCIAGGIEDFNERSDLTSIQEMLKEEFFVAPRDFSDSIIKVLRDDNKPCLGFIIYMAEKSRGYIYYLVVGEQFRKRGYGRQLFNFALDDLRGKGASSVSWYATGDSRSFYECLGFGGDSKMMKCNFPP